GVGAAGPGRLRPTTHCLHPGQRPTPALAPQTRTRHGPESLPHPAGISPTPRTTRLPRPVAEIQPARTRPTQGVKEPAEGPCPPHRKGTKTDTNPTRRG